MFRRLLLVLMTLALCSQSLAFAGRMIVTSASDEIEHAVLHWNSEMHHHDEQGKLHKDLSSDSKWHLAADDCCSAPFVLAERTDNTAFAQHGEVPTAIVICTPDPFLQGIKRPPR